MLVMAATQMAVGTQDIHLAFRDIKGRRLLEYKFDLPDLPKWFKLYRSHHKANNFIRKLITDYSVFSPDSIALVDYFTGLNRQRWESIISDLKGKLGKISQEEQKVALREGLASWTSLFEESFLDLRDEDGGPLSDPENVVAFSDDIATVEGSFFYLVHIPCWLLYQESPTRIYRKARTGDYDAIERLLRLDALMIHDPTIGKQIQRFRISGKIHKYLNLMDAVLRKPKNRITRKKMKYSVAGFISGISHALKQPLDAQEITDLFDAIAQDFQGLDCDEDIPNKVAFNKAIQRDRAYWMSVLTLDNKS